jgi:hypothetical protein
MLRLNPTMDSVLHNEVIGVVVSIISEKSPHESEKLSRGVTCSSLFLFVWYHTVVLLVYYHTVVYNMVLWWYILVLNSCFVGQFILVRAQASYTVGSCR